MAIFFAVTGAVTAVGPIAGGYPTEWTKIAGSASMVADRMLSLWCSVARPCSSA